MKATVLFILLLFSASLYAQEGSAAERTPPIFFVDLNGGVRYHTFKNPAAGIGHNALYRYYERMRIGYSYGGSLGFFVSPRFTAGVEFVQNRVSETEQNARYTPPDDSTVSGQLVNNWQYTNIQLSITYLYPLQSSVSIGPVAGAGFLTHANQGVFFNEQWSESSTAFTVHYGLRLNLQASEVVSLWLAVRHNISGPLNRIVQSEEQSNLSPLLINNFSSFGLSLGLRYNFLRGLPQGQQNTPLNTNN